MNTETLSPTSHFAKQSKWQGETLYRQAKGHTIEIDRSNLIESFTFTNENKNKFILKNFNTSYRNVFI